MCAANHPIRILHLEDNRRDAQLIHDLLAEEDLPAEIVRVTGREEYETAVASDAFDAILTDFNVPDYDGLSALQFAKRKAPTVPVIVISGSLGEEAAVRCLKEGATDYLLKQRLDRLGSAVRRALHEAEEEKKRRLVEAALRESEERFRQLAETIEDVFWSASSDFKTLLYVSPAFERVWGRSVAELRASAQGWIEWIHPEDRSRVQAALQRLAEGVDYEIEHRILLPDGSTRWILTRGFAVRDAGQRVYRAVGVARDITAAKLSEEQRRRSEERFTAIFNAAPIAFGLGTMDGEILDVNPETCRFFGYSRSELIGQKALQLWAEPEARITALATLRAEKTLRNYEAKFRRKTGEIRSALLSMEILQFEDQPMYITMLVDITDQKALETQLQRSQRVESVGRLASGIAHDMNNILAPIMMAAPLLRMGMKPADVENTLSTIETSAQRGAALVRQLLIFGRGVEGERRPVALAAILDEVVKVSRQTFPRNITIATEGTADSWPVTGDSTQLHQVLLNLCVNARDAMPNGGSLSLSLENITIDASYAAHYRDVRPGRYVRLRVADTGTGIVPELMERIFEPFFTTKEVGRGTGLGLSTVLGIVKSHGGFVRVQSEVGRGTTFVVHLPASLQSTDAATRMAVATPMHGDGELVLVVDDEEPVRTVLREMLVRHNYKVVTAQDGVEATAVFAANQPEAKLVITDLDMPLLDGVNLARILRRMNPDVRIVISTGLGGRSGAEKRRAELDALHVDAILAKPYTADKLLRVIHEILQTAKS